MILESIYSSAELLPAKYDNGIDYRRLLVSIAYQESDGINRKQLGGGPARGLWQCEQGTTKSRGGVTGVMLHPAVRSDAFALVDGFGIPWESKAIWSALEFNDVLAAGIARLLLWTGAGKIPSTRDACWDYYEGVWRPGKPRPEKWPSSWALAEAELLEGPDL